MSDTEHIDDELDKILEDLKSYSWSMGNNTYDMTKDTAVSEAKAAIKQLYAPKGVDEVREQIRDIHKDNWDCIGHSEGQACCMELDDVLDTILQLLSSYPQLNKQDGGE